MTEESFVQAILDEPEARENYLVFADWLDERGETARAHVLRLANQPASHSSREEQRTALTHEIWQCQRDIEASWPAFRSWLEIMWLTWERGLPQRGTLPGDWPGEETLRALPPFPYLSSLFVGPVPPPELAELLLQRAGTLSLAIENLSAAEIPSLARLRGLKGLTLFDARTLQDDDLAGLASLAELRSLNLVAEGISDAGLAHLRGFRKLERLGLESTQITDAGLKTLLGFPGVKGRLKSLDLGGTQVTAAALDLIVQCKELRSLSLRRLTPINDDNVMRLSRLPELRELDLSETGVTRFRMPRLSKFPKLERIRTRASLGVQGEREEMREMKAFLEDMHEADVFVEVDYE